MNKEIKTIPVTGTDYNLLRMGIREVFEDGTVKELSYSDMNNMGISRVTHVKSVLDGSWREV